jgi:hypothetical protein
MCLTLITNNLEVHRAPVFMHVSVTTSWTLRENETRCFCCLILMPCPISSVNRHSYSSWGNVKLPTALHHNAVVKRPLPPPVERGSRRK